MSKMMIFSNFFIVIFLFLIGYIYYVEGSAVHYDYIIVGGGTAGCVLASRLTENPHHTVLVLEAGISDLDYPTIDVPLLTQYLQATHIDWEFKTEPQKFAGKALNNRQVLWPQGKVLGGSSSHNYLDYIRGSSHDYDYWSDLGNEGWSYEEVLPYFKKSINMRDETLADSGYHNVGGLWDIETPDVASNLVESLLQGSEEMGFKRGDVNGKEQAFSQAQHNTRYGRRMSSAAAFLRPAMRRKNLHVITEAYVTQIIIQNKIATGVKYVKDGEEFVVSAKREVIVSAGTLMSPKILMLSGIGPKEHLQSHGIEVITDLPVGSYLNDHPALANEYSVNASVSILPENFLSFESAFKYNVYGKGDFASSTLAANGFFSLPTRPPEQKYPDIQWVFFTVIPGNSDESSKTMKKNFGFNSSYWDEFYQHQRGKSGYTISTLLLHPRTNGTVRLRSKDPFDTPVYTLDYFEHPDDVKDMIQSIRLQQKLLQTDAMRSLGAVYECPHHSGCLEHTFDSNEYWECFLKYNMFSCYHYTSSCRMASDDTGVVDNKLRVKGIGHLRVVDASIMPFVPSGNTMTPTVMIAEKAADMIKEHAH